MKLLLFIFIIYINYSLSQINEDASKKTTVKPYPKKVGRGLIKLLKAYIKPVPETESEKKKGEEPVLKDYTVFAKPFPDSIKDDQQIVPDSPYFPVSPRAEEQKPVKKVLPEQISLLGPRFKRSADIIDVDDRKLKVPKVRRTKSRSRKEKNPIRHSSNKAEAVKRSKASKLSNNKGTQIKKLKSVKTKSAKTLRRPQKSNKTRGLFNDHRLRYGARTKQKTSRLAGTKKIKSSKKRQIREGSPQKKLKPTQKSRNGKKLKSEISDSKKKLKQRLKYNRTSNHRAFRNSKGPDSRRLIAARDALVEEYPYVVSFQKDQKHWCSGALLNPRLTITTANCLWRSNSISRMRVRACSRHTDRGGQLAKIQEVMKHPGWKLRTNPDNDVALVLLDRNIRLSHSCHGVDLPNRVMLPAFDDAWVTSWGSERRDGIYDTRGMSLQVYHTRLIEREKCNNVTQRFGVAVTENFICLAQTGKRGPCTRDTGAPAVSDGVLWGLASWGIRKLCGTERFPAMFSYLASTTNMDFITNATHYLMADERHYPFGDRYPIPKVSLTIPPPMTLPY